MRKISMIAMAVLMFMGSGVMAQKAKTYIPWENGKLKVSDEGRYLRHENGTPFFWLGETGWLMPERLNRDEVNYYLQKCKEAGYNMVQVQVLNSVPSYNIYGKVLILTGGTLRTLIRKASMAIGTTWIISLGRQLRKVSISVWYVFGEALWMPD